jgi:hypothetical protein
MISSQLSRPRGPRHLRVRSGIAFALLAAGLGLGGCATQPSVQNLQTFVSQAPLPTWVPRDQVLMAAEQLAAQHEGDFVLCGFGHSMEPVYGAGTTLVVHPTAMHMLRKGMAVVYRNARGVNVTHMLLEKTGGGWRAIGLNNLEPDGTLVTEKNLVGIIKHAFSADGASVHTDVAALLPPMPDLARGPSFALLH